MFQMQLFFMSDNEINATNKHTSCILQLVKSEQSLDKQLTNTIYRHIMLQFINGTSLSSGLNQR